MKSLWTAWPVSLLVLISSEFACMLPLERERKSCPAGCNPEKEVRCLMLLLIKMVKAATFNAFKTAIQLSFMVCLDCV